MATQRAADADPFKAVIDEAGRTGAVGFPFAPLAKDDGHLELRRRLSLAYAQPLSQQAYMVVMRYRGAANERTSKWRGALCQALRLNDRDLTDDRFAAVSCVVYDRCIPESRGVQRVALEQDVRRYRARAPAQLVRELEVNLGSWLPNPDGRAWPNTAENRGNLADWLSAGPWRDRRQLSAFYLARLRALYRQEQWVRWMDWVRNLGAEVGRHDSMGWEEARSRLQEVVKKDLRRPPRGQASTARPGPKDPRASPRSGRPRQLAGTLVLAQAVEDSDRANTWFACHALRLWSGLTGVPFARRADDRSDPRYRMLLQHVLPPICDGLDIGWLPNRMDQVWRSTNDELRANLGVDGQDDWPDAFDPRGNAMLSDNTPLPDREELRLVRQAIVLAAECMRDPVWLARLIRRDGSCRGALIAMCRYMKESVFVDRRTPPADNEVTFKEMASYFDVVAGELVEADLLSLNELPQEPPPEAPQGA